MNRQSIGHRIGAALSRLPRFLIRSGLLVFRAASLWFKENGPQLGAAIAFYAMFAMAPLLLIGIVVAGAFFGEEAARGQIVSQIAGLVGTPAAQSIESMVMSAWRHPNGGWASTLGVITLLIGATGVFTELRRALNTIGHVTPPASVWSAVLRARVVGLALVLGFGFLAIASLLLSAVLAALSDYLQLRHIGMEGLLTVLDLSISAAVLTLAFAALLRWVPDGTDSWKGVWMGAACSATLFSVGKHVIGFYLARTGVASSYGAAGSFVMVMLWVYYSAQILLFGYALTVSWDRRPGSLPLRAAATAT